MDLQAIETAICAALRAACPGLEVLPYPDAPETFRATHPRGTLLVIYRGADYAPPSALDVIVQEETSAFEVVFLLRNLRGHAGAYPILRAASRALVGWAAPGLSRGWLRAEKLQSHRDGEWQWSQLYAWRGELVSALPALCSADDRLDTLPVGSALPGLSSLAASLESRP